MIKTVVAGGGGAERVLAQLTSQLVARGHDVEIASFDAHDGQDFYAFDPRISRHRLAIGGVEKSNNAFGLLRSIGALRRLIARRSPDVCIGFMHSAFVPLSIAASGTGIPVIASEHTVFDHYRTRALHKASIFLAVILAEAFTATSERVRSTFPRSIAGRMVVIPNPVAFPRSRKRERGAVDRRVLLSVGSLRPEKGHEILVAAFAELAEKFSDWDLKLVGDGPCRGALELAVDRFGIGSRVTFTGAIANVAAEYASADLFAVPSSYESFGLATAEAMAIGIPVVGFADCPGTSELVVAGVNGVLVSGKDRSAALAEGLALLMSDEDLRRRLGASGPESVAQYSLDASTDKWEELIETVRNHRDGAEAAVGRNR